MDEKKLSVLGHLHELRRRFTRCVIALAITIAVSFVFWRQIFHILTLPAAGVHFIYTEVTEMISITMRVSLAAGVILALPYLTYELIMFVSPALRPREKKYAYIILPWVGLMFAGGVTFAYFFLIPPAMKFLLTFGGDIAEAQIRIGNYIAVVTRLLLVIGLVFELPVVISLLARLGVVSSKWLAARRRMAIILIFILSAMITPTIDPINQSLVAGPLIVLFEMSIWLAKILERRRARASVSIPSEAS
ncbi:MAG: twin-arginine translocase subunit TatC [Chloroflexi bacterium]|nr:twin-arginine translocase subunit TatC [Chloroflexota bacterium]